MINMIKADFYRVFKSKAIYIGIALMLFIIGVSVYIVEPGTVGTVTASSVSTDETYTNPMDDMTYEELQNISMSDYRKAMLKSTGYHLDKAMLANNINLYYVFIFVAALAVAVDFSGSSVKNTLSSAISRNKYFLSKTIFTAIVCLAIFFANTFITYFANLIFNGENLASSLGEVTKISLMQLPAILALVSILNGLAFITRKSAIFNTITIMLIMDFQILLVLATTLFNISEKYTQYEIQTMLGRLAYNPSNSYIAHSYILCAVVIFVFTLTGYISFKKAEIK